WFAVNKESGTMIYDDSWVSTAWTGTTHYVDVWIAREYLAGVRVLQCVGCEQYGFGTLSGAIVYASRLPFTTTPVPNAIDNPDLIIQPLDDVNDVQYVPLNATVEYIRVLRTGTEPLAFNEIEFMLGNPTR